MGTEGKATALLGRHRSLGAKLVSFGGWSMPLQYKGILAEHAHTRSSVSIFDTCHMGELILEGPGAQKDVSHLVCSAVDSMEVGRCRYGLLLNEQGGILDDLVVYRQDNRSYMLVVNAATAQRDAEWIGSRISAGTSLRDESERTGKIDVQGPRCLAVLEGATELPLRAMRYYHFTRGRVWEFEVLISRTGYTGELGYELYVDARVVGEVWDRLSEHPLVEPAGLGARDTLRLEMGYPLYGQDVDENHTPLEAGFERHVDLSKDFLGRPAVVQRREEGLSERLVGLALEGRQAARHGFEIWGQGQRLGAVTSGCFAPSVGRAVALGYVASAHAGPGTHVKIRDRARALEARIVDVPFYRRGTVQADPTRSP